MGLSPSPANENDNDSHYHIELIDEQAHEMLIFTSGRTVVLFSHSKRAGQAVNRSLYKGTAGVGGRLRVVVDVGEVVLFI